MSHQIRRNSNSVSSSPTHPQAKVNILINNKRNSHFISTHQSSPAVELKLGFSNRKCIKLSEQLTKMKKNSGVAARIDHTKMLIVHCR